MNGPSFFGRPSRFLIFSSAVSICERAGSATRAINSWEFVGEHGASAALAVDQGGQRVLGGCVGLGADADVALAGWVLRVDLRRWSGWFVARFRAVDGDEKPQRLLRVEQVVAGFPPVGAGQCDLLVPVDVGAGCLGAGQYKGVGSHAAFEGGLHPGRAVLPLGPVGDMQVDPVACRLLGLPLELALDGPALLVVAQVVEHGHQVDVALRGLLLAGHRPEQHHARRPAPQDRRRGPLRIGHCRRDHRRRSQGCRHEAQGTPPANPESTTISMFQLF